MIPHTSKIGVGTQLHLSHQEGPPLTVMVPVVPIYEAFPGSQALGQPLHPNYFIPPLYQSYDVETITIYLPSFYR